MNVLVFDIETVPDTDTGRRMYDIDGLDEAGVAKVMASYRKQETEGRTEFLRHHLHRVVAIAAVLRTDDRLNVWSLGEVDSGEKELLQRFFDGIERYTPTLVSWNGGGFDLPVLHYRALYHGVNAARYWESGEDDTGFRWNNYLNRFHARHTDLMDVLSAYQARAAAPLHEIATLLGFPGKIGMQGGDVWQAWLDGRLADIRAYCETDVLNTYLIWLRYELMRGRLSDTALAGECARLRDYLAAEDRGLFKEFLAAWRP
ncbi:MAG: 3'-5' exonuclease [Gammaproteobacteria bacterium]